MSVRSQPEKIHIEQRPSRIEARRTVEGFELAFVSGRGRFRGDTFGRNRMDVGGQDRRARQKCFPHHAVVTQRVIVRYESLVAPEPMRSRPGECTAISRFGQMFIELLWGRTAREAN